MMTETHLISKPELKPQATTNPVHVHAPIARARKSVRNWQRFKTDQPGEVLRSMTADQKVQHLRELSAMR